MPHVGKSSVSLEVKTPEFGLEAGSWRLTSQLIGLIDEQSAFSGQHSADEELSRETQAELEAHLKLSGNEESTVLQLGWSLRSNKLEAYKDGEYALEGCMQDSSAKTAHAW